MQDVELIIFWMFNIIGFILCSGLFWFALSKDWKDIERINRRWGFICGALILLAWIAYNIYISADEQIYKTTGEIVALVCFFIVKLVFVVMIIYYFDTWKKLFEKPTGSKVNNDFSFGNNFRREMRFDVT